MRNLTSSLRDFIQEATKKCDEVSIELPMMEKNAEWFLKFKSTIEALYKFE